ncbi:copper transporter [Kineosporia sp. R_H_3]|uniref:copper transporter n=1 Tax=Kineosporia sp. R_H_3 TaxID=1961848 RepID=UPI000B4A57FD|nr:copper transporter [Kineosporia sp. R_H_3]
MIDFRYHLVSLVSVFIALAVGILLGAGPLQQPLEQGVSLTLQQQVEALRADRQQLRDQLDSSQAGVSHRDEVITELGPQVVAGRLPGRSVVLVVLPDAATDRVGALTRTVEAAGGTVVGRLEIEDGWTDPAQAADREDLATKLVAGLPAGSPVIAGAESDPDAVLAGLLARALVAPTAAVAGTPDPAAVAILDGMREAGLVRVAGSLDSRAELAVVLAPGVESATVTATTSPSATTSGTAGASASPSQAPEDRAGAWNALALALDSASSGTVVVGPGSSATSGGVVAAVRGDADLEGKVTTVDTGGTAMGDVTTVVGLAEQLSGRAGRYGFGAGATGPLPELAAVTAAGGTPSATATP